MLLDMLSACPEFRDDFLAWEPMSYREHFRLSQFRTRDLAVAAYDQADPNVRNTLDTLAVTMTIVLEATRAAMDDVERRPETVAALAGNAIGWLTPLIARARAIINGESVEENAPTPQDVVDRFDEAIDPRGRRANLPATSIPGSQCRHFPQRESAGGAPRAQAGPQPLYDARRRGRSR